MSETRDWIIEKIAEPEEFGTAYIDSLATLPGGESDLSPDLPVILKKRSMSEEEVEEVRSRSHIEAVYEDKDVYADTEISTDAARATMAEVRRYHGFDVAHRKGYRGQGRKAAIVDTGLAEVWEKKLGKRLVHKSSVVSGEDWKDTHSGHGTHVCGTIAEAAPEAEIMVYKSLSTKNGSGKTSGTILCVNDAVKRGATDINLSLGGDGNPNDPSSKAVDAARREGVSVSVAAGNSQRGRRDYTADKHSPGCSRRGICVACGDISHNLSDFSSWGKCVDIRAVGEAQQSWAVDGGYTYMSGTSMAAPVVCAATAVCGSHGASAREIEKALYSTTGDTRLPVVMEGAGILDVEFAVKRLARRAERPPKKPKPTPPSSAGLFSHPSLREEE